MTQDSSIHHQIIKNQTKTLKTEKIIGISKNEREILIDRLDELTLNRIFEDDLAIFEDLSDLFNPQNIESDDYKLFKDIENLSLKPKRKGTRYAEAQLDELKLILEKYPAHQSTIRNEWNISILTFRLLKKEIDGQIEEWRKSHWRREGNEDIDYSQRIFIQKVIKPPTLPTTRKKI